MSGSGLEQPIDSGYDRNGSWNAADRPDGRRVSSRTLSFASSGNVTRFHRTLRGREIKHATTVRAECPIRWGPFSANTRRKKNEPYLKRNFALRPRVGLDSLFLEVSLRNEPVARARRKGNGRTTTLSFLSENPSRENIVRPDTLGQGTSPFHGTRNFDAPVQKRYRTREFRSTTTRDSPQE